MDLVKQKAYNISYFLKSTTRAHPKIFIGTVLCIFFIGIPFTASILSIPYQQEQRETIKRIQKQKQQEEYEALLEKQKNSNTSQNKTTQAEKQRNAHGRYTLTIVFVKPPTISVASIQPLVNALTVKESSIFDDCIYNNCSKSVSLAYIPTYFTNQAKKYNVYDFSLDIKYSEIKTLSNLEGIGDIGYVWGKDPFGTVKLQDTFENTINNDKSIDNKPLVAFLYFDNSFSSPSENKESFYEYKKFRSFALQEKGRTYVNVYDFSPQFAKTVVKIIAHETLHLFGSTDKYLSKDEDRICGEKGYGNPDKRPRLPQETADIMCLYIETKRNIFKAGHLYNNTLVINKYTAEEIGWIKD